MPRLPKFLKLQKSHLLFLSVEKGFKDFFISYAKSFNNAYNRTGSLFQRKYKKKEVGNDSYLSSIVAYIHLNPVRAGLCTEAKEWKFSSYNAYLSSDSTSIKKDEILKWFGGIETFKKFHAEYRETYSIEKYLFDE